MKSKTLGMRYLKTNDLNTIHLNYQLSEISFHLSVYFFLKHLSIPIKVRAVGHP